MIFRKRHKTVRYNRYIRFCQSDAHVLWQADCELPASPATSQPQAIASKMSVQPGLRFQSRPGSLALQCKVMTTCRVMRWALAEGRGNWNSHFLQKTPKTSKTWKDKRTTGMPQFVKDSCQRVALHWTGSQTGLWLKVQESSYQPRPHSIHRRAIGSRAKPAF